jgi:hypothetical protein
MFRYIQKTEWSKKTTPPILLYFFCIKAIKKIRYIVTLIEIFLQCINNNE